MDDASNEPEETRNDPAMEDEALAAKPPAESKLKSVEEAVFCTASNVLSVVVAARNVSKVGVDALVVAAMVTTERASYVVVPIERLSLLVTSATKLPLSLNPEESEMFAALVQAGMPLATLSTWPVEPMASLFKEAAAVPYIRSPVRYEVKPVPPTLAESVEEADQTPAVMTAVPVRFEESMPVPPYWAPITEPFQAPWMTVPILVNPPETVKPLEVRRPTADKPPEKVEVADALVTSRLVVVALAMAALVRMVLPPETVRPLEVSKPAALIGPLKVDEPVAVDRIVPPVKVRPAEELSPTELTPPLNVEVAVLVTARLEVVAEVKAVDEARKVPVGPTVRLPTTVEEALEMKPTFWVSRPAT